MKLFETEQGNAHVLRQDDTTELRVEATSKHYSNAQIASYQSRADFTLQPPVRLSLTAWFTGQLHGTAGFGFWNHPFAPGSRGVHLPKAVWLFHSTPPNDMALAMDVPGSGWKCATFDATRWQFLALLPTAPVGLLLMRIPALYKRLWPIGQGALGVSEHLLDAELVSQPHQYMIEWLPSEIRFYVDGALTHTTSQVPRGPLGFVAWVDTQFAVVTPQGEFGFGLLETAVTQSLFIRDLLIETL